MNQTPWKWAASQAGGRAVLRVESQQPAGPVPDILRYGDGSVHPGAQLADIAAAIGRGQPAGIIAILIGIAAQPGWRRAASPAGGAVLIGLLLPAFEQLRRTASARAFSPELAALKQAMGPGGALYLVDGAGAVTPLGPMFNPKEFTIGKPVPWP
ncbi:MAG: hypothetical protein R2729_10455 [Bryobacteraceae bacterium]